MLNPQTSYRIDLDVRSPARGGTNPAFITVSVQIAFERFDAFSVGFSDHGDAGDLRDLRDEASNQKTVLNYRIEFMFDSKIVSCHVAVFLLLHISWIMWDKNFTYLANVFL